MHVGRAQQEVFLRFKKAFDGFFRGEANYPKLKKYKDYNILAFPQFGFKPNGKHCLAMSFAENGKLYNKRLGEIEILFHRPIEGTIKQFIIKQLVRVLRRVHSLTRKMIAVVQINIKAIFGGM
ncbi:MULTISPECIES: hypothetical protein [unclassified Bacillus (in: firmicutes)]|uniref:hypothetical protein n=1 Tax=unclassified Bacillus (in: firmicutes) TaxID=185979 RepID=UPI0020C65AB1|nr:MULTISPECIES: hypothetical protein [unclassified Bacillus (in: firmicutes)]